VLFRETGAVHFGSADRSYELSHQFSNDLNANFVATSPVYSLYKTVLLSNYTSIPIINESLPAGMSTSNLPLNFTDSGALSTQYCQAFLTRQQYVSQAWRNIIIRKILLSMQSSSVNTTSQNIEADGDDEYIMSLHFTNESRIGLIPFYAITAGRHDYHQTREKKGMFDCVHWCSGPMIWLPVWQYVADFYFNRTSAI
jgi:hypothetical protein